MQGTTLTRSEELQAELDKRETRRLQQQLGIPQPIQQDQQLDIPQPVQQRQQPNLFQTGGTLIAGGALGLAALYYFPGMRTPALIFSSKEIMKKILPRNPLVLMAADFASIYWMPGGTTVKLFGQCIQGFIKGMQLPSKLTFPAMLLCHQKINPIALGNHYIPQCVQDYGVITYVVGTLIQAESVASGETKAIICGKKLGEGVHAVLETTGNILDNVRDVFDRLQGFDPDEEPVIDLSDGIFFTIKPIVMTYGKSVFETTGSFFSTARKVFDQLQGFDEEPANDFNDATKLR